MPSLLILKGQRRQADTLSPDTQWPLITWFQYSFLLAWKSFSPQLFKQYHISSNLSEIKWLTPYWISEGFAEKKITEFNCSGECTNLVYFDLLIRGEIISNWIHVLLTRSETYNYSDTKALSESNFMYMQLGTYYMIITILYLKINLENCLSFFSLTIPGLIAPFHVFISHWYF